MYLLSFIRRNAVKWYTVLQKTNSLTQMELQALLYKYKQFVVSVVYLSII